MTERNAEPSAGAGAATDELADVDSARGGAGADVVPATIDVPELEPQRFCEPQALFASQQLLEGLAPPGAYTERAWLSPDELLIYFIAVLPSSRSVWQASRAARSSAFGAGGPVPGPILPGFYDLAVSADGRTLLGEVRTLDQHRVVQLSSSPLDRESLEVVMENASEPWLSADAKRLYFIRDFGTLMLATRAGWGAFGSEREVFGSGAFGASANGRGGTVLTQDELSLYYSEPFEGQTDIYLAQRENSQNSFAYAGAFGSLNSDTEDETPDWLSPDGCRLYFERGTQLLMASK